MAIAVKEWIEIRAKGSAGGGEEATALLVEAGSRGVIEEVPFEPLPFDVVGPFVGDMTKSGKTLTLIGYISAEDPPKGFDNFKGYFLELRETLSGLGWRLRSSAFKDELWTEKWKRF